MKKRWKLGEKEIKVTKFEENFMINLVEKNRNQGWPKADFG